MNKHNVHRKPNMYEQLCSYIQSTLKITFKQQTIFFEMTLQSMKQFTKIHKFIAAHHPEYESKHDILHITSRDEIQATITLNIKVPKNYSIYESINNIMEGVTTVIFDADGTKIHVSIDSYLMSDETFIKIKRMLKKEYIGSVFRYALQFITIDDALLVHINEKRNWYHPGGIMDFFISN